jgi:hypothetical protein
MVYVQNQNTSTESQIMFLATINEYREMMLQVTNMKILKIEHKNQEHISWIRKPEPQHAMLE